MSFFSPLATFSIFSLSWFLALCLQCTQVWFSFYLSWLGFSKLISKCFWWKLGHFWPLFLQMIFRYVFTFFSWDSNYTYVASFHVVLGSSEALVNFASISLILRFGNFLFDSLPIFKFTHFFHLHSAFHPIQWIFKFQLFDFSFLEFSFSLFIVFILWDLPYVNSFKPSFCFNSLN